MSDPVVVHYKKFNVDNLDFDENNCVLYDGKPFYVQTPAMENLRNGLVKVDNNYGYLEVNYNSLDESFVKMLHKLRSKLVNLVSTREGLSENVVDRRLKNYFTLRMNSAAVNFKIDAVRTLVFDVNNEELAVSMDDNQNLFPKQNELLLVFNLEFSSSTFDLDLFVHQVKTKTKKVSKCIIIDDTEEPDLENEYKLDSDDDYY